MQKHKASSCQFSLSSHLVASIDSLLVFSLLRANMGKLRKRVGDARTPKRVGRSAGHHEVLACFHGAQRVHPRDVRRPVLLDPGDHRLHKVRPEPAQMKTKKESKSKQKGSVSINGLNTSEAREERSMWSLVAYLFS